MSRRKLFFVGVTAIFAVPLFAYLALIPRATAENYQLIHEGMVLADVEALLGKPISDPVPAINFLFLCSNAGTLREEYAAFEGTDVGLQWQDGGGSIIVGFKPGGTVTFKRYDSRYDEPLLDRCRWWIGVLKKGW